MDKARIFLSHNSKDKDWARALSEALAVEFDTDNFLDEESLKLGDHWDQVIRESLRRCGIALVLLGGHGWGPFHRVEAMLALERTRTDAAFRFVPVLLPGVTVSDQESFADGKVFAEIHRLDLSGLASAGALADPNSEPLIAGLRRLLSGEDAGNRRSLTPFLLRRESARWDQAGRPKRALYADARLDEGLTLLAKIGEMGTPVMHAFVTAGIQRRSRKRTLIATGSVCLAAIFAVISIFALRQSRIAESRARAAESLADPNIFSALSSAADVSLGGETPEALAAPFSLLERTGQASRVFQGPIAPITAVTAERDNVFAGTSNGEVWRWHGAAGERVTTFDSAVAALFAVGEKLVVCLRTGGACICGSGQRQPLAFPKPVSIVAGVQKDTGMLILFEASGGAWTVDCRRGLVMPAGDVPATNIRHVAMAGSLIYGATDEGTVFLWRIGDNRLEASARVALAPSAIAWDEGGFGYVLAGNKLQVWNPRTARLTTSAIVNQAPTRALLDLRHRLLWMNTLSSPIARCSWSGPDQEEPADSSPTDYQLLSPLPVHSHYVTALGLDDEGDLLSADAEGLMVAWKSTPFHALVRFDSSQEQSIPIRFAQDDERALFLAVRHEEIQLRSSRRVLWQTAIPTDAHVDVCPNRCHSLALVDVEGFALILLDLATHREVVRWPNGTRMVAAEWDDGFVVVPRSGGQAERICRDGTRTEFATLVTHETISALAGCDGRSLIAAGTLAGTISLADARGPVRSLKAHAGPVFALDFSSGGAHLMSGGGAADPNVKLWSTEPLALTRVMPAEHRQNVAAVRYDPADANLAATVDESGLVVLWDLTRGRARGRIQIPGDPFVVRASYEADGSCLWFQALDRSGTVALGPQEVARSVRSLLVETP